METKAKDFILTASDFMKLKFPPRNSGLWRLDPDRLYLILQHPKVYKYDIDLESCTTSAQILDWIAQIAGKNWGDDIMPEIIGELVLALNDYLRLQSNFCSWGEELGPKTNIREIVTDNLAKFERVKNELVKRL